MEPETAKRPKWDVDLRLESLLGENVRVGADAFVPPGGVGESKSIKAAALILPDGGEPNALVFFEGKLVSFTREVGVVHVMLEPLPFQDEAANGRVLFRGRPAVILHGPATVKLSHPFFVERLSGDISSYWQQSLWKKFYPAHGRTWLEVYADRNLENTLFGSGDGEIKFK